MLAMPETRYQLNLSLDGTEVDTLFRLQSELQAKGKDVPISMSSFAKEFLLQKSREELVSSELR